MNFEISHWTTTCIYRCKVFFFIIMRHVTLSGLKLDSCICFLKYGVNCNAKDSEGEKMVFINIVRTS